MCNPCVNRYTADEVAKIVELSKSMTHAQVAHRLGRTRKAIEHKLSQLRNQKLNSPRVRQIDIHPCIGVKRKIPKFRKDANNTVYRALKDGVLKRKPCEVCGDQKSEAHHEDYSKPLEVNWLCSTHHRQADAVRRKRLAGTVYPAP